MCRFIKTYFTVYDVFLFEVILNPLYFSYTEAVPKIPVLENFHPTASQVQTRYLFPKLPDSYNVNVL